MICENDKTVALKVLSTSLHCGSDGIKFENIGGRTLKPSIELLAEESNGIMILH